MKRKLHYIIIGVLLLLLCKTGTLFAQYSIAQTHITASLGKIAYGVPANQTISVSYNDSIVISFANPLNSNESHLYVGVYDTMYGDAYTVTLPYDYTITDMVVVDSICYFSGYNYAMTATTGTVFFGAIGKFNVEDFLLSASINIEWAFFDDIGKLNRIDANKTVFASDTIVSISCIGSQRLDPSTSVLLLIGDDIYGSGTGFVYKVLTNASFPTSTFYDVKIINGASYVASTVNNETDSIAMVYIDNIHLMDNSTNEGLITIYPLSQLGVSLATSYPMFLSVIDDNIALLSTVKQTGDDNRHDILAIRYSSFCDPLWCSLIETENIPTLRGACYLPTDKKLFYSFKSTDFSYGCFGRINPFSTTNYIDYTHATNDHVLYSLDRTDDSTLLISSCWIPSSGYNKQSSFLLQDNDHFGNADSSCFEISTSTINSQHVHDARYEKNPFILSEILNFEWESKSYDIKTHDIKTKCKVIYKRKLNTGIRFD